LPSPLASAVRGGSFSCVRSIRSIPQSEKALSRIEVDFTGETLEKCDDGRPAVDGQSDLLRGTYLPGIARPTWNDGSLLVNPGRFTECTGAVEDGKVLRRCEVTDSSGKRLTLTLTHNHSDFWSVSISPVDQDYPVAVQLVAPPITHAAVDEHKNIWLGDGKGHSWVLINNRTALMNELWRRTAPLRQILDWSEKFPEVTMNMTNKDLADQGPDATSNKDAAPKQ
jgi:hypothetical protein